MAGNHPLSRRDFIKAATAAIGGSVGLATTIPLLGYLFSPALRKKRCHRVDCPWAAGKLPGWRNALFFDSTLTSVNGWERTALNYGIFVVRQDEQAVRVFSNICTHLGCRVTWHPNSAHYVSPCHDGHFALTGEVISGPPPRSLDEFTTKIENGSLFIQLPPHQREV